MHLCSKAVTCVIFSLLLKVWASSSNMHVPLVGPKPPTLGYRKNIHTIKCVLTSCKKLLSHLALILLSKKFTKLFYNLKIKNNRKCPNWEIRENVSIEPWEAILPQNYIHSHPIILVSLVVNSYDSDGETKSDPYQKSTKWAGYCVTTISFRVHIHRGLSIGIVQDLWISVLL